MNEEAYLRELSDLGRRHGIGLTGRTQLYHLEPEDMPSTIPPTPKALCISA